MFTGLVEEVGTVDVLERRDDGATLRILCDTVVSDAGIGDSIAVNGCCLTVTSLHDGAGVGGRGFSCEMMGETLARTALADAGPGTPVNLERAMSAGDRLGGHMVQGHVDGVASVVAVEAHDEWTTITYELPEDLARYVVSKGSITIDGTSLTVMAVTDATFSVGLIPHTMAVTTHGGRAVGDRVNLEVDVIAKYVERMLSAGVTSPYSPSTDEGDSR